jgi:5'-3' exonuclease
MMTSMGEPTGAIYGCLKTLRASINLPEFITRDLMIVWDGRPKGLSPRRVAMYPGYKIHDDYEKVEDQAASERHRNLLEEQRPKLCRILQMFGIPQVDLPYREGDDIIGVAVRELSEKKLLVMSDDRDYYQLVSDRVHVYRAGLKEPVIITPENFKAKIGVTEPCRYLVSAAIAGDGSDAITGIPGVGGTTADRVANSLPVTFRGWVSRKEIVETAEMLKIEDSRNRKRYAAVIENFDIVARNIQLMDLRLEGWNNVQEREQFFAEFSRPRIVNDMEILRHFHSLEFKSYINSFSDWIQPFKRLTRCE